MTAQTKATNKARFQDQDVPSGNDYADLIDSYADFTSYGVGTITTGFSESTPGVLTAGDNAKLFRASCPHYLEAEEAVSVFGVYASAGHNHVYVGGGLSSVHNASTFVEIWGAANNTTLLGTKLARFSMLGMGVKFLAQAGGPTVSNIEDGFFAVWKNTSNGEVAIYANDGGVIKKSAAFT